MFEYIGVKPLPLVFSSVRQMMFICLFIYLFFIVIVVDILVCSKTIKTTQKKNREIHLLRSVLSNLTFCMTCVIHIKECYEKT